MHASFTIYFEAFVKHLTQTGINKIMKVHFAEIFGDLQNVKIYFFLMKNNILGIRVMPFGK